MHFLRDLLLAAVVVGGSPFAGVGQTTPSAVGQAGSIAGTVYEAGSFTPIERAEILLYQSRNRVRFIRTDSQGRFAFRGVEPVIHALTANKNGYVLQSFGSAGRRGRTESFKIQPGQKITDANFYLERAAVVTGRILDQDGDPAPDAYVHLMARTYALGRRLFSPRGHARTNDLGEYRIPNVSPGRYFIGVDYSDRLLNDPEVRYEGDEQGDYDRTFHPGVEDPGKALPVDLGAGEMRAIDIQLRRVPTVRVSGSVRLAGDAPLPERINLEFYPTWDISGRLRRRFVSPDIATSAFEFPRVPRGPYVLRALEHIDGKPVYLHRELEIADVNIENLDLTLNNCATVRGRILVVGVGAEEFSHEKSSVGLSLYSFPYNPGQTAARADKTGSVLIENIVPSTYTVKVSNLPPDAYLKSVRLGDRELPDRQLTLEAGETIDGLEAVVSLGGGRIDGIVLDQDRQPATLTTVVAVPLNEAGDRPRYLRTAETDAQGRYAVRGLAPGRYRLLAFDERDLEPGFYQAPGFLDNCRDQGEEVEVRENSRLELFLLL